MTFYRRSIIHNFCLYRVWAINSFMGQSPKHTTELPCFFRWDTDEEVTTIRLLASSFELLWMDDELKVVNFKIERHFINFINSLQTSDTAVNQINGESTLNVCKYMPSYTVNTMDNIKIHSCQLVSFQNNIPCCLRKSLAFCCLPTPNT